MRFAFQSFSIGMLIMNFSSALLKIEWLLITLVVRKEVV